MTTKSSATERLGRLLALVPWVAAHPGGVEVDEVCQRFAVNRGDLMRDLDTVMMVGIYPFTPDTLIEAWVENDRVMIHYADTFARPVRLTADEAVTLVAAARGLMAVPGVTETGALSGALDKIVAVLGSDASDQLDVELGNAPGEIFTTLIAGRNQNRQVEIDYASPEGERNLRRFEPAHLFSDGGYWYASGWCHLAGAARIFRVDRMIAARLTDDPFAQSGEDAPTDVVFDESLPQVVIEVDRSSAWLFDTVPVLARDEGDDVVTFRLAVGSPDWLTRALVQLGPAARVIADDAGLGTDESVRNYAASLLERYA